ncbi:mRNA capping enzyme, alpha subunit [Gigaspora margarita]|uniref:mRNA-capping enzyme subunit alpha n=1 Tax=Gigaspora margarita TaxID=4874 RepID=A0A8H3X908_GIGMA|nr:mRNA capping enzyme, alpha subunit [Gigaspora margarita]
MFTAIQVHDIPGQLVDNSRARELRARVKELVNVSNFPGAQPVSFTYQHLHELENENYFVCEKSDGIRVLLYLTVDSHTGQPCVYLIDRKNNYHQLFDLLFPIPGDDKRFHDGTIVDGELIIDVEDDGMETQKLLAFDLLVVMKKNLMKKPLTSRLGYLREHVIEPYKALSNRRPGLNGSSSCIKIEVKPMELSYGLDKVLHETIPKLKHKSDGLIFTSSVSPYTPGTCEKMLKWKPPNENSVDLQLRLEDGRKSGYQYQNNFNNRPRRFLLYKWMQKDEYSYFDDLYVTDEEWEEWQRNEEPLEKRIVEVTCETLNDNTTRWRFLRFRDDKHNGNHYSVVDKILESIMDGISEQQLIDHIPNIRNAWKQREKMFR